MSAEYIQEIECLLEEAEVAYKEFDDVELDNCSDIYKQYIYNACLQWDLRRSQLKEKLADVKYGKIENKFH